MSRETCDSKRMKEEARIRTKRNAKDDNESTKREERNGRGRGGWSSGTSGLIGDTTSERRHLEVKRPFLIWVGKANETTAPT